MTRIRRNPSLAAWFVIFGGAAVFEAAVIVAGLAVDPTTGQMLSHAYSRAAKKHPVITHGTHAVISLHLIGALPMRLDPFQGFGIIHPAKLIGRSS